MLGFGMPRASGVLLHPTSFPSPFGIGDLGSEAEHFLEWLAEAGQRCWQVLPLGPVDKGASPYQSPSAFAGNPLLLSPEKLARDGLLTSDEVEAAKIAGAYGQSRIPFEAVEPHKLALVTTAAARLVKLADDHPLRIACRQFVATNARWLTPMARFMALRGLNDGAEWSAWTRGVDHDHRITPTACEELAEQVAIYESLQFLFFRQWGELREKARQLGVSIIGDVPIYVSYDSADVWANRQLFQLDHAGKSTCVAGVPPDYFSATGQLWNNPLYDWAACEQTGYEWWIDRIRAVLATVDLVRLDHFRGFEAYWSVPAGETTAINGQWIPGPGASLFEAIARALGEPDRPAPLIAEDLGLITEPVRELRRRFGFPGMQVLQFILPSDDPFSPESIEENSIAYTGTHDNPTSRSWFLSEMLPHSHKLDRFRPYSQLNPEYIAWDLISLAWRTNSRLAIAPLQDLLNLGDEARMNTPGTCGPEFHNWCWQYQSGSLTADLAARLRELTVHTDRAPQPV